MADLNLLFSIPVTQRTTWLSTQQRATCCSGSAAIWATTSTSFTSTTWRTAAATTFPSIPSFPGCSLTIAARSWVGPQQRNTHTDYINITAEAWDDQDQHTCSFWDAVTLLSIQLFSKLIFCFCVCADLTNAATFRDLNKPVGALNKERLERLLVRLYCIFWIYMYIHTPVSDLSIHYILFLACEHLLTDLQ